MAKILRAISKFFASLSCLEDNSDEIGKYLGKPAMHTGRASAFSAKAPNDRASSHGPYSGTTRYSSSVYSQASGYSASVYSQASGWGNSGKTLAAWSSSDSRPMPMDPWEKYRLELHGIMDGDFVDGVPVPQHKISSYGYSGGQRQVSRYYPIPR